MALSEARRASLLAYCRIEEPTAEELLTLEGLYDAAVGYLEQAGVSEPEEGTPRRAQYDLCVNFMVLRDFDLREATITGTIVNDNPAFRRLLTQLKLTEPDVSKLDTSGRLHRCREAESAGSGAGAAGDRARRMGVGARPADLGLHHVTAENQPVFQGGHRGQERRRDRAAAAPHPPPRPPLG